MPRVDYRAQRSPQVGDKYLKLPKPWKRRLFKVILHTHKRKRKWSSDEAPTAATQAFSVLVGGAASEGAGKKTGRKEDLAVG